MAQTEDIPYEVSEFATPEDDKTPDPDQPKKSVLESVSKYLEGEIAKHNSFDAIMPAGEQIMTTQQQVEMHKQIVVHLRNIKSEIDAKIKELK